VAAGWAEFRASYRRAAPWQAGFAATSLVTGAAVGLLTGHWLWLAGAVAVGAAIPFTLAVIMPINHRLLGTAALPDEEVRQLLHRWGRLHAVRTVLGAVSCLAFLRAVGGR
jgi:hypothetical protein